MAGQDIRIPNPEEVKAVQAKQTAALNGLVEDVAKSVTSLKGVDTNKLGKVGTTAVEYSTTMYELLKQAAELNEEGQKNVTRFISALEEVENANFSL